MRVKRGLLPLALFPRQAIGLPHSGLPLRPGALSYFGIGMVEMVSAGRLGKISTEWLVLNWGSVTKTLSSFRCFIQIKEITC
jgi:hypothetical protein